MKQSFESYLEEYYEQNVNSNSNNMNPEFESARDGWFSNLDVQEVIDLAETWGAEQWEGGHITGELKERKNTANAIIGSLNK